MTFNRIICKWYVLGLIIQCKPKRRHYKNHETVKYAAFTSFLNTWIIAAIIAIWLINLTLFGDTYLKKYLYTSYI